MSYADGTRSITEPPLPTSRTWKIVVALWESFDFTLAAIICALVAALMLMLGVFSDDAKCRAAAMLAGADPSLYSTAGEYEASVFAGCLIKVNGEWSKVQP